VGIFQEFIGVDFWTALFTLLNFLAVLFVGKRFLWGPVMKIITDRQKEIDDLYADAGAAKENALAMQTEYQEKLAAAAQTSEQMVQEAVVRGQKREEAILLQANQQARAMLEKASADIQQEKKKAMNEAKDEISDLAMAIATKVVDRELNAQDHQRLVNEFIDRLGDGV
jgi:F-type H+-transporting ATPase subunit b